MKNIYGGLHRKLPEKVDLSVVIPAYSKTEGLKDMALALCKQVRPMCDELIISEDSGVYWPELQQISDLYLMHENLGDVVNAVLGMRVALGEYIAMIHTDIKIIGGSLRSLCAPGRIVCPHWQNGLHQEFVGHFWVMHRSVLEEYGPLLVERQGLGADYEYKYRTQRAFSYSQELVYEHADHASFQEWHKHNPEESDQMPTHPKRG